MNRPALSFAALALLGVLLCIPALAPALGARPSETPESGSPATEANGTWPAAASGTKPSEAKPTEGIPDDAAALAQYQVLREYFERQATLDDRLPEVYSRRVRKAETMAFVAMRETVNSRGQLERFRMAKVDLSGLVFKRVTADPDLARIHVTGHYTLNIPPLVETMEEDALFVLLPEMGQWKIFERREGWR